MDAKKAGEYLNTGADLLAKGRTDEAIKTLKKATSSNIYKVSAHFNIALAYQQNGDIKNAIKHFKVVTEEKPSDFEAFNNLGHLYMQDGEVELAQECFHKATQINPHLSEGFYNLAVTYMQLGEYEEAIKYYKESLKLYPNNSIVLNNIGVTLEKLDRGEEAVEYYIKALNQNPNNAMALANMGSTLMYRNPRLAKKYFDGALKADPTNHSAKYNLGVCLRALGDTKGSIECFEEAIELNPDYSPAYGQLYHQVRDTCDWKKAEKIKPRMIKQTEIELERGGILAQTPFGSVVYGDSTERNFEIAKAWSTYIEQKVAPYKKEYTFKRSKKHKKIRIGYLSSDFKNHATSHLILGMLKHHDTDAFEVFTYSYGINDESSYRKDIEKVTKLRECINLTYLQTADAIYADEIDILIDLKGHTAGSRQEIPALRPAPIQVNYLGFPGTSGASYFDYFITDTYVTQKDDEPYYSEKLVYLPDSYQVNDDCQDIAPKLSRKDVFLPEDGLILACFNGSYKIDPNIFDIWCRILKAVPETKLCLLDKNVLVVKNLLKEARKRGLNKNRIIFAPHIDKRRHLGRLQLCDLALDTLTCNGHTTTSDALWAGLPVLTVKGPHFASRVASSLLQNVGMPELVMDSPKAYEKMAIELASHPKKIAALKKKLLQNKKTTPLFDTQTFTTHIEEAYKRMYNTYTLGKKPRSFKISDYGSTKTTR